MKLLIFLLSISFSSAFAQQAVVANGKMNIVYCDVENPLSALAAGYPCESVVLTTNNGSIKKSACGKFTYIPKEVGLTTITVWVKQGQKLKKIEEIEYRAKSLGPSNSLIGSSYGGNVTASYLRSMGGVRSCIYVDGCCQAVTTVSYRVTIERNKNIICFYDNVGSQYSPELMESLQKLKTGDIIFISAISCQGWAYRKDEAEPLKFTIIN